jgi:hypothetical protein
MTQTLLFDLEPKVRCSVMCGGTLHHSLLWCHKHGYIRCRIVEWRSNCGDWTYIVTHDGYTWFYMYQIALDHTRSQYLRVVDETSTMYGTSHEVEARARAALASESVGLA